MENRRKTPEARRAEEHILRQYRRRKKFHANLSTANEKALYNDQSTISKATGIVKFKQVAKMVRIFVTVCNHLISYAAEHGKYSALKTNSNLKIHSAVTGNYGEEDNLWFDPAIYRSNTQQVAIPKWARRICRKGPAERTDEDLRVLCCLMRQLEVFQKYTKEMLNLLARATTSERFDKGRVIVRKGHVGRSLYAIFNGSVAMLKDGNEDSILKDENEDREESVTSHSAKKTVLTRGDSFGKEALFKLSERKATAVCLEATDFLVIDLDDVRKLGFDKCLHQEISNRFVFFRSLRIFDNSNDNSLQIMAERSWTYQYFSDKIIERDSKESEYVYFCKKGQCDVLRKIDKRMLERAPSRRHCFISRENNNDMFIESRNQLILNQKKRHGITGGRPKLRKSTSEPSFKLSNGEVMVPSNPGKSYLEKQNKHGNIPRKVASNWNKKRFGRQSTHHKLIAEQHDENLLGESKQILEDHGSKNEEESVIVKVATLSKGDFFGLRKPDDDEQEANFHRSFTLISSGCEVIAIKRNILLQNIDQATKEGIWECIKPYPCDERLYLAFQQQKDWRSYRQKLITCLKGKKIVESSGRQFYRLSREDGSFPIDL